MLGPPGQRPADPAAAEPASEAAPASRRVRHRGSVQQTHFRIESIERDTIRLAGNEFRAVVECVGVAVHLLPHTEQEGTLAGYAAFLNALPFPTQLLVRVQRRSLEPHIRAVQESAGAFALRPETGALARIAAGYIDYLTGLHEQAVLLDRRSYVVIPADPRVVRAAMPVPEPFFARLVSRLTRGRHATEEEEEEAERLAEEATPDPRDAVFTHLQFRCDQVVRLLARSGMQSWRVTGAGLHHLIYSCWNPEQARLYPLSEEHLASHTGEDPRRSLVGQPLSGLDQPPGPGAGRAFR